MLALDGGADLLQSLGQRLVGRLASDAMQTVADTAQAQFFNALDATLALERLTFESDGHIDDVRGLALLGCFVE